MSSYMVNPMLRNQTGAKRGPKKQPLPNVADVRNTFLSLFDGNSEVVRTLPESATTPEKVEVKPPAHIQALMDDQGHSKVTRKLKIRTGMKFGDLEIIRKMPRRQGVKSWLAERWKVRCVCGSEEVVPKYYLLRMPNPKTNCGCKLYVPTLKSSNKREYLIYHMMHQRCENPNHVSYKHYQKLGIGIHPSFHKTNPEGFANWFAEVGASPSPAHSIDRIRNAKGYEPGNLRWSTAVEQRMNQGDTIGGKTLDEIMAMGLTEEEWVAFVRINGYGGSFASPKAERD
jgi:hypothetical protein